MLDTLQWPPLQERRRARRLTHLYKVVNNLSPVKNPDYVLPSSGRTRTHDIAFVQLRTNYEQYRHSFLPNTTREWNGIPRTLCTHHLYTSSRHVCRPTQPRQHSCLMFLIVYTIVLTMLLTSLARDASAMGSIKVEVEVYGNENKPCKLYARLPNEDEQILKLLMCY